MVRDLGDCSISNSNVSGKLGFDYQWSEEVLLYASYNRGFKSGGFNAGFIGSDFAEANERNANVTVPYEEEILTSYEIGIKSELLDRRVRLNAAAFYYDYKDFQALSFFGVSQFIVNSDAEVIGLEFEALAQPVENLTVQFGANWLDTKVDVVVELPADPANEPTKTLPDRDMVLAPKFSFNGLGRYQWQLPMGRAVVQVDFNYQGEHFFDITNSEISRENGYMVWNARLGWVSASESLEVALFAENFTDEEYRVYTFNFTDPGGFNQVFLGRPAWIGVNALYRF